MSIKMVVYSIIITVSVVVQTQICIAENRDSELRAKELLDEIMNSPTFGYGGELSAQIRQLSQIEEVALLPLVKEKIVGAEGNELFPLILILEQVKSKNSKQLLLDIAQKSNEFRDRALSALGTGHIELDLGNQLTKTLLEELSKGSVEQASIQAQFLARCTTLNSDVIIERIVEAYLKALQDPKRILVPSQMTLSFKSLLLSRYLKAFENLGVQALPHLEAVQKANNSPEVGKWLMLATFVAGDNEYRKELELLARTDDDYDFTYLLIVFYAEKFNAEVVSLLESVRVNIANHPEWMQHEGIELQALKSEISKLMREFSQ